MTQENIIFASYGIPLIALNILTVVSIVSIRKTLNVTSFHIYMLTSAVNLLTYLNTWFGLRLYAEKSFNFYYYITYQTVIIPYIQDFLIGLCYFAQNINSALLTVDRYVSIVAIEWKPRWHRYWSLIAAVLYILSGVGYFFATGSYDPNLWSVLSYDAATDTYSKLSKSSVRIPIFMGLEAVFGILFIVLCAYLNTIAWIRLKDLKTARRAERSFFFISFIIFISQSVNIIIVVLYFQFFAITYNLIILWKIFTAMLYTSDIFSLGPGLYMLVVPGPIRRRALRFFPSCIPSPVVLFTTEVHSSVAQKTE